MNKTIILALIGYFIFSVIDLLAKQLTVNLSLYQIAGQSALFVSLFSLIYFIVIRQMSPIFNKEKVNWFIIYIFSNATNITGLFWLLSKTTQSQIYPILLLMPFVLPLFSFTHKGIKIPYIDFVFLTISFMGVLLIVGFSPVFDVAIIFVTFLVMLLASLRAYSNNQIQGKISSVYLIVGSQLLLFILTLLIFGGGESLIVDMKSSLVVIIISFFATIAMALMIYVYTVGIPHIIAAIQYSQLIWGALFGYIFFGERLSIEQMVGVLLVISSGVLFALYGKKLSAKFVKKSYF